MNLKQNLITIRSFPYKFLNLCEKAPCYYKCFDLEQFSSIINELKTKSNYDKEFSDEIS
jgi:hypothetical protein